MEVGAIKPKKKYYKYKKPTLISKGTIADGEKKKPPIEITKGPTYSSIVAAKPRADQARVSSRSHKSAADPKKLSLRKTELPITLDLNKLISEQSRANQNAKSNSSKATHATENFTKPKKPQIAAAAQISILKYLFKGNDNYDKVSAIKAATPKRSTEQPPIKPTVKPPSDGSTAKKLVPKIRAPSKPCQCDKQPIDDSYELVDKMTSRDYQTDPFANIQTAAEFVNNKELVEWFKLAILQNRHLFSGRTVLDVGCGLGLLSLLAAKAGAAHVYAVDCSNIIEYTRRIVAANSYADIIHVIKGRIENIELPVKHVDIIICDWVGYSVLFESICDAVIYARNKWLRPNGGLIVPDVVQLCVTGIQDSKGRSDRVEWWNYVYDFKMNCIRDWVVKTPVFKKVRPEQILTSEYTVYVLNLNKASHKHLGFRSKFKFNIIQSGCMDGICTYFRLFFTKSHVPLWLNTDPSGAITRWLQSVFYFDTFLAVNTGQNYYGGIAMNPRDKTTPDFNNMELNFEMYSGEPNLNTMELLVDMEWELNQHLKYVK